MKAADAFAYDAEHLYLSGVLAMSASYQSQPLFNVYVAAFAVYFRNVHDFLFLKPAKQHIRASHFYDGADKWSRTHDKREVAPATSAQYADKHGVVEVLHICLERIDMPKSSLVWRIAPILVELAPVIAAFLRHLDATMLEADRRERILSGLHAFSGEPAAQDHPAGAP